MAKRAPKPDKEQFSEAELDAAERRLRKLARNPNFISGIYNYCDRWCERCPPVLLDRLPRNIETILPNAV